MKHYTFVIIVLLFVVGCQPAEASPTPTDTASPMQQPTAIPTPIIPPLRITGADYPEVTFAGPEGALYRLGMGWYDKLGSSPVSVSPESNLLALPATTGLYVYTADDLEPVWAATNKSFVKEVIWSPDCSRVIGLYDDATVSVFAASDGTLLHQFSVKLGEFYSPARVSWGMSMDNLLLFLDGHLYDVVSGEELACVYCTQDVTDVISAYYVHMAFTAGSVLRAALPCDEMVFCLWSSDTRETVPYSLAGVQEGGPLSISPDGNWVLVRTDGEVRLFDVQTETFHQLPGLTNIPFSEDGFHYLDTTWAPDSSAFTINTGEQIYLFRTGSEASILSWDGKDFHYFLWSPDSSILLYVTPGNPYTAYLYTVSNGDHILEAEGDADVRVLLNNGTMLWETGYYQDYFVGLLASTGDKADFSHSLITDIRVENLVSAGWTPDNLLMVINETQLLFFDGSTGKVVTIQDTGVGPVGYSTSHRDFQWSADGSRLVWLINDQYVKVPMWDRATGEVYDVYGIRGYTIDSIAFSLDGDRLLAGNGGTTIALFDVETGEKLHEINEDNYGFHKVVDLAWSPDGSQFASVDDRTIDPITIWDAESFTPLYTLMPRWENRTYIEVLNWAGDLIAADSGEKVFVWQASTQSLLWSASLEPGDVDGCSWLPSRDLDNRMALSADGRYLAVVTGGASQGCDQIAVYDAHTGELLHIYPGNGTTGITQLVWSPDGQYLASVAREDTIVVWDTSLLPPVDLD